MIPPHVRLVLAAANTIDVERATDAWETPTGLVRWLAEHTGGSPSAKVTTNRHLAAVRLRDALRDAILEGTSPAFGDAATPFPLRLHIDGGVPTLRPVQDDAIGGVARVLAAVAQSAYDGTWERIKICQAGDCRWAFFDKSRNHSRAWCSMQVCGNRTKTRTYRARHQT